MDLFLDIVIYSQISISVHLCTYLYISVILYISYIYIIVNTFFSAASRAYKKRKERSGELAHHSVLFFFCTCGDCRKARKTSGFSSLRPAYTPTKPIRTGQEARSPVHPFLFHTCIHFRKARKTSGFSSLRPAYTPTKPIRTGQEARPPT